MNSLWHALSDSKASAPRDSFLGRLSPPYPLRPPPFFFPFCPNSESLTYADRCASLKEFNKLKCRGLFFPFFSPQ